MAGPSTTAVACIIARSCMSRSCGAHSSGGDRRRFISDIGVHSRILASSGGHVGSRPRGGAVSAPLFAPTIESLCFSTAASAELSVSHPRTRRPLFCRRKEGVIGSYLAPSLFCFRDRGGHYTTCDRPVGCAGEGEQKTHEIMRSSSSTLHARPTNCTASAVTSPGTQVNFSLFCKELLEL